MFRPMLAVNADLRRITYPVLASYKLDGVRAIVKGGALLSRTLKPIPNWRLQELLGKPEYEGWDGELAMLADPTEVNPDCYRDTVSTIMTEDCEIDGVQWYVFDNCIDPQKPYYYRYQSITSMAWKQLVINNEEELQAIETAALVQGYEGLILRDPAAPYKYGRSTLNQGWMLKVKRFSDDEATVVDFEELMHNANPAEKDERGYTKHSHHQENKIGMNILGALVVRWHEHTFRIGTGFTNEERYRIWKYADKYRGQLVKFKYLHIGMKDLPRHPVFLGWRHTLDTGG